MTYTNEELRSLMGITDRVETIVTPTGCIEWHGSLCRGYGKTRRKGRRVYTHRLAFERTRGPIPAGMFVCHSCDNPCCFNPDHLWLGTTKENMADAAKKNRHAWGTRHPGSKLTDDDVAAILSSRGCTQRSLATHYGVGDVAIHLVVNLKTKQARIIHDRLLSTKGQ